VSDERPLLVGVAEAANTLGIGIGSTRDLIRQGRIRHLRVGRRILVPVSALAEFVERATNDEDGETR
jgi:excisionase family DNA binding protein